MPEPIKVPYFQQPNEFACGAAAFAMVYKYLKPSKVLPISPRKLYVKVKELEPHGSGNFRISTDNLIKFAQNRNLYAEWGRVGTDHNERVAHLRHLLEQERLPVIVCQRYTDDQPLLGHFRVVLSVSDTEVMLHDPCPTRGGPFQVWDMDKFIRHWEPTGANVTGGVATIISDRPIASPLGPQEPNPWRR